MVESSESRCILLPAFNEELTIRSVIACIRAQVSYPILVVDDGSYDQTAKNARDAGVSVIRHPYNMGYGTALQTGYKYAFRKGFSTLVQMDADGQHDPSAIQAMVNRVESGECDLLIGSRFLGGLSYNSGLLKSIGVGLFRLVIRVITGKRITDPTSGYQCMNRRIIGFFTGNSFPYDYPDANVIVTLHRVGFRIEEHPVAMLPNPFGRAMHRGVLRIAYYIFKVSLAIFVALLREKKFYSQEVI
jgi:glycosyltransferase involved in cell wall biosynthesis